MTSLNEYITRIEKQDTTLTSIDLINTGLNDADAERLMQALHNNPAVAKNIKELYLDDNRLTSINIPATLIALGYLDLSRNLLTSINIPATLTALYQLYLDNNQLTSLNIPATLTVIEQLELNNNQLTSLHIPATLTTLEQLELNNNQLTSIDIPTELTALRWLSLDNNRLTSIDIPAELTALEGIFLENNQLTMAIKLVLRALMVTRTNLTIEGINNDNNIAAQLNLEILQAHFEAMRPVFLAKMQSRKFTNAIINLSSYGFNSASKLPLELIIKALIFNGIGPIAELNKNIAMFKGAFANDEQQLNILEELDLNMDSYKENFYVVQQVAAESVLNEFKSNMLSVVKEFFIDKQKLLRTKYFEIQESDSFSSELIYNIAKIHFVNSMIFRILSIQKQHPELTLECDMKYLMFGHPKFAEGDPLVKMVENVTNEEPELNFNILTPAEKCVLTW
jgi:Leucine-rich repeat (LRR) protein